MTHRVEKVHEVTSYVTSDGATFRDLEEAEAYQHIIDLAVKIDDFGDQFIEKNGQTPKYKGRIRSIVRAWELYKLGKPFDLGQ